MVLSFLPGPGGHRSSASLSAQKLAAVHPEGRCGWLSYELCRLGSKFPSPQMVRTSCWSSACA